MKSVKIVPTGIINRLSVLVLALFATGSLALWANLDYPIEAVLNLRPILRDGNQSAQLEAIRKIEEIGPEAKDAIPDLLEIQAQSLEYRNANGPEAKKAVIQMGIAGFPELIKIIKIHDERREFIAFNDLGEMDYKVIEPALIDIFNNGNKSERACAANLLERIDLKFRQSQRTASDYKLMLAWGIVIFSVLLYAVLSFFVCRYSWRKAKQMQSRLWRNTFKAAVIALLFSPSIIGAEGGMAPGPALVVLILNIVNGQFFGHGKDGFFWFLLLICAPMLVVWSIAFAINYAKDKNRQIISEKETGVL